MTALTKDRNTHMRDPNLIDFPMAAVKIFAGALVVTDAGYAKGGIVSTTVIYQGRAEVTVDNSAGAAGDKTVVVRRNKAFKYVNDGSITVADIGKTAFIVDDQTVADNNGTSTRSACGMITGVDSDGVWIV